MRPRALYFCLFVILASQGRFMALVLTDSMEMGEEEVGWTLGFGILGGMVSAPFWSARADFRGCRRVLTEIISLHVAAFALLPMAKILVSSHQAIYVFCLMSRFLSASLIAPSTSVLDGYTLKVLDDTDTYGRERLFGAISWAMANILMGVVMDTKALDPLSVCLVFLALGTTSSAVVLWFLPNETPPETLVSTPPDSALSLLTTWCARREMMTFFVAVTFVMGAATSLVENLLFLYMKGELHASYTVCGASVVVTVLFEIPLFFVGKSLLSQFGIRTLLLAAMACYVCRVVVYTLVSSGMAMLVVEPLHGVTYALLQSASGLLSVFKSMGSLLGTVGGGWLMETMGSSVLFRTMAVIVLCSMAVVIAVGFRAKEEISVVEEAVKETEEDPLKSQETAKL